MEDIRRFESEFLDHLRRSKGDLLAAIRETGKFEESTEEALKAEIDSFKKGFEPSNKENVPVGDEAESGDDALDSAQEQIVKQKR